MLSKLLSAVCAISALRDGGSTPCARVVCQLPAEPAGDNTTVTVRHGLLEMALQLGRYVEARIVGVQQRRVLDAGEQLAGERMDRRLTRVFERDMLLALPHSPL